MAKARQKSLGLADAMSAPPHFHGHRQRLIAAGAEALPDYELMEVLLFAGNPRGDVKPLAKNLIERFGGFAAALSADPDELLTVPGLGVSGVAALKSVREAALRLMKAELRERPVIGSWDRLIDYCRAQIAYNNRGVPPAVPRPQERADRARTAAARHGRSHAGLHPRGGQTRA
jgi:DNA repair protein RadC